MSENWQQVWQLHDPASENPEHWLRYARALVTGAGDAASESDRQQQAAMALLQAQSLGADKEQLQSQLEGWLQEDLETAMTALNI
jgi:uncharacterized protein YfiM (DUF2279 family)